MWSQFAKEKIGGGKQLLSKVANVVAPPMEDEDGEYEDDDEYYEDGEYYEEGEEEYEDDDEDAPPKSPFGIVNLLTRALDREQDDYDESHQDYTEEGEEEEEVVDLHTGGRGSAVGPTTTQAQTFAEEPASLLEYTSNANAASSPTPANDDWDDDYNHQKPQQLQPTSPGQPQQSSDTPQTPHNESQQQPQPNSHEPLQRVPRRKNTVHRDSKMTTPVRKPSGNDLSHMKQSMANDHDSPDLLQSRSNSRESTPRKPQRTISPIYPREEDVAELERQVQQEKLEKERMEQERLEKERAEKERVEKEKIERARLEKERQEKERMEKERLEKERAEQERLDKERLEQLRQQQAIQSQKLKEQQELEAKKKQHQEMMEAKKKQQQQQLEAQKKEQQLEAQRQQQQLEREKKQQQQLEDQKEQQQFEQQKRQQQQQAMQRKTSTGSTNSNPGTPASQKQAPMASPPAKANGMPAAQTTPSSAQQQEMGAGMSPQEQQQMKLQLQKQQQHNQQQLRQQQEQQQLQAEQLKQWETKCQELQEQLTMAQKQAADIKQQAAEKEKHSQEEQTNQMIQFQQKEARLLQAQAEDHEVEMSRFQQDMMQKMQDMQQQHQEEMHHALQSQEQQLQEASKRAETAEREKAQVMAMSEKGASQREQQSHQMVLRADEKLVQVMAQLDEREEEIQKLNKMIASLQSNMKEHHVGAAEAEEELDELHTENETLRNHVDKLSTQCASLKQQVEQLEANSEQLSGLRMELQVLKEQRARERNKSQLHAESAKDNHAQIEQERDAAIAEVHDLKQHLAAAEADLQVARADAERIMTANNNLQSALESFQSEREAEMVLVEEQRLEAEEALNAAHKTAFEATNEVHKAKIREIQAQADEQNKTVMLKVQELEMAKEQYRVESVQMRRSLDEAIHRLQTTQEDVIDRQVIKNILLDWLTKTDAHQKRQVLELMASLLHFTDEEKSRVHIQEGSEILSQVVHAVAVPLPPAKADMEHLEGENVREKWLNFLMAETDD